MSITLEQVLKAYEYADSHPHKYLRGTTNWCAAVAHALNVQQPAPVAVVLPERMKESKWSEIGRMFEESATWGRGYNKALDDTARLNGVNQ